MKKINEYSLQVILTIMIMVFAVYVGTTLGKRFQVDFTEENLYTLSDSSKNILNKLKTPLTIKLYYSKTAANKGSEGLRNFNIYFTYVESFLHQYVSYGKNKIKLEVIDPRPDTEDEEDALAYGLKQFQITDTEKYFFGLVVVSDTGTEKVIEFFDPNRQEMLEYEVSKLLHSVQNPQKKVVGILSSLEVFKGVESPYMAQLMRIQGKTHSESWLMTKVMQEFYDIKKIGKPGEEIDSISGVDILMVVHPKDLKEKTLFAIDQFLMKGGKVIIFVDPHTMADKTPEVSFGQKFSHSTLDPLFKYWGVEISPNVFAGDRELSEVRRINQFSPPIRLLPVLKCDKRCTSGSKSPIATNLNNLMFIFPGEIKIKETSGIKADPLVQTTSKGNTYVAMPREIQAPHVLNMRFREGEKPVNIAVKLVGKFKTGFSSGIKGVKAKDVVKESPETAVIIYGDVDFITDQAAFSRNMFGIGVINDNHALFMNSLNIMAGPKDLIGLRAKGRYNRNFERIKEIELASEKKTSAKVEEINNSIQRFSQELQNLGRQQNGGNVAIIKNEGMRKQKELMKKVASLKKELREVKRKGREKIEGIGKVLQYLNTLFVPFLVLVFGVYYQYVRRKYSEV